MNAKNEIRAEIKGIVPAELTGITEFLASTNIINPVDIGSFRYLAHNTNFGNFVPLKSK